MPEIIESYDVVYCKDDDGWWVAEVKGIEGCHTQGKTVEETRARIREAMDACGITNAYAVKMNEIGLEQ